MSGPAPKKKEARRRRNKPADGIETQVINLDELIAGEVEIPVPNEKWESLTHSTFDSFTRSGQVIFMEPSDWATLYFLCDQLDRNLKPQPMRDAEGNWILDDEGQPVMRTIPMSGATLSSFLKGLSSLMATEADRRRLKLELERKSRIDAAAAGDGVVVDIVAHRADAFTRATQR